MRLWSELALTRALQASLAAARGDFTAAVAGAEESERLATRSGYGFGRLVAVPVLAYAAVARGDADGAVAAIERLSTPELGVPWPFLALVEAGTGRLDAAYERVMSRRHRFPQVPTLNRLPTILAAAVVAGATGDEVLATDVEPLLAALHDRGVRRLPGWPVLLQPDVTDLREASAAPPSPAD
jgi:hypothetical protein